MERSTIVFLILQTLLWKIPSICTQRAVQQYIHVSELPYSTVKIPARALNTATVNQIATTKALTTQPICNTGIPALSALSLPSLIAGLSKLQAETPKPSEVKTAPNSNIDARLLNNLAIALQLLILSNILNTSPPDQASPKPAEFIPEPVQNQLTTVQNQMAAVQNQMAAVQNQNVAQNQPQNLYFPVQQEQMLPNANFVGTSNSADPNLAQTLKNRSNLKLMSPYEALGKFSAFSEPVPQFSNPRKDFMSPYAMIDKDFFQNDLF